MISTHGMHLKASAAMVRLRLYDILALLPPKTYEGIFCSRVFFAINIFCISATIFDWSRKNYAD